MVTQRTFFQFAKVALGQPVPFDTDLTEDDWEQLFTISSKQAVAGLMFNGVVRFHDEYGYKIPQKIFFKWLVVAEHTRKCNALLNQRTAETVRFLHENGLKCCILKGQGNALLYPDPSLRSSGDIDVWVVEERKHIFDFVRARYPEASDAERHIELPLFSDVHVEVHYYPSTAAPPHHNKRQKVFYQRNADEQLSHIVQLPADAGEISVPTPEFNVVAQLSHMLGHLLIEGFGLKQVIDFYYVLQNVGNKSIDWDRQLKHLGLLRFARGMMWLQKECLGLQEQYLIVEPDEKIGKVILTEVYEGGNMGYYDTRYHQQRKNYLTRGAADVGRLLKMMPLLPTEVFWKLIKKAENQLRKVHLVPGAQR